jgi:hypothetical protein
MATLYQRNSILHAKSVPHPRKWQAGKTVDRSDNGASALSIKCQPAEICEFLEYRGEKSIYDISKWDDNGFWTDWNFSNVPDHLLQQTTMLKEELRDAAPVHKTEDDKWGWGPSGSYSSAKGYELLQPQRDRTLPARFWMEVWDTMALPKVNFFFWTLMHKKILTGENLMKRNIVGPHRCSLCKEAMETMDHLFVDCLFANKVWNLILHGLKAVAPTKISVVELFTTWKDRYPSLSSTPYGPESGSPSPNLCAGSFGLLETSKHSTIQPGPQHGSSKSKRPSPRNFELSKPQS